MLLRGILAVTRYNVRSPPPRRASVMIEKFAAVRGMVRSEFLDLNRT